MSDALAGLHETSGKVREIYSFGDTLLMVTSDRISAFDVIMPTAIPDKGRVLTGLSKFWFDRTAELVPNHLISIDRSDFPAEAAGERDLAGRSMLVRPLRMLRNLEASHGLVFSGRALLALVEAGAAREQAYEIVQRNALRAWDEETSFRDLLEADPDAMALVDAAALDRVFDLESFLRHVDAIFDRTLDALEMEHV